MLLEGTHTCEIIGRMVRGEGVSEVVSVKSLSVRRCFRESEAWHELLLASFFARDTGALRFRSVILQLEPSA